MFLGLVYLLVGVCGVLLALAVLFPPAGSAD